VTKATWLIPPLALVLQEDVQLARLLQSVGAQADDQSGFAVAEAVAKLCRQHRVEGRSADEVEL